MFAIVEAGGRQEKVTPGGVVVVDRLAADPGAEVTFDRVLLVERDTHQTFQNPLRKPANAILSPSGDHEKCQSSPGSQVSCVGVPPSLDSRTTWTSSSELCSPCSRRPCSPSGIPFSRSTSF